MSERKDNCQCLSMISKRTMKLSCAKNELFLNRYSIDVQFELLTIQFGTIPFNALNFSANWIFIFWGNLIRPGRISVPLDGLIKKKCGTRSGFFLGAIWVNLDGNFPKKNRPVKSNERIFSSSRTSVFYLFACSI